MKMKQRDPRLSRMKRERAARAVKAFARWLARLTVVTACLTSAGVFLAPIDAQLPAVQHCGVCLQR